MFPAHGLLDPPTEPTTWVRLVFGLIVSTALSAALSTAAVIAAVGFFYRVFRGEENEALGVTLKSRLVQGEDGNILLHSKFGITNTGKIPVEVVSAEIRVSPEGTSPVAVADEHRLRLVRTSGNNSKRYSILGGCTETREIVYSLPELSTYFLIEAYLQTKAWRAPQTAEWWCTEALISDKADEGGG